MRPDFVHETPPSHVRRAHRGTTGFWFELVVVHDSFQVGVVGKRSASVEKPAMAATTTQSLSALLRRTTIEDHEEVLKACNSALKKSKTDLEAQHVKVVALLKLDRYDDALRVIEAGGDKLKERIPLEQAYAQYKLGNYVEAAKIANVAGGERGIKHVEAQTVRGYMPE